MWNKIRRVLWNKIPRNELEPGAHIYTWTWRGDNTKESRHGIYFDDKNVIHFTQGDLSSNHRICRNCGDRPRIHGVVSSCLDCFLSGGDHDLYLFEYGVSTDLFLLKPGWNTCTTARADPNHENVRYRAFFLLDNNFVGYNLYIKNSYDFAIYCKTGLIVFTGLKVGRDDDPVASFLVFTVMLFLAPLREMPPSFTALTAAGLGIYSTCRLVLDIGTHPNVIQVEVNRFAQVERLAFDCFGSRSIVDFEFKLAFLNVKYALIYLAFSMWSTTRPLVWALAGFKFLYWAAYNRTFQIRRVLANKIERRQLQPGDHIYTWRGYFYTHHGIYVGQFKDEMMVIHLTRGTAPIVPSSSSTSQRSDNNNIGDQIRGHRVEICSIDTFLEHGQLYRYDYGVDLDFFIAKSQGGTSTLAYSDPPGLVRHRAYFLLEDGFGAYDLFHNNCEDFAIYCKTGLLLPRIIALGRSGQIISIVAAICALISFPYSFLLTSIGSFVGGLALGYVLYSMWRLFSDTGYRRDARIVGIKELAAFERVIDFWSQRMPPQLLSTLVPKLCCCLVLIGTFFIPEHLPFIRSQNCLVDWILAVNYLWATIF